MALENEVDSKKMDELALIIGKPQNSKIRGNYTSGKYGIKNVTMAIMNNCNPGKDPCAPDDDGSTCVPDYESKSKEFNCGPGRDVCSPNDDGSTCVPDYECSPDDKRAKLKLLPVQIDNYCNPGKDPCAPDDDGSTCVPDYEPRAQQYCYPVDQDKPCNPENECDPDGQCAPENRCNPDDI